MNKNRPLKTLFIDDGNNTLAGIKNALTLKGIACTPINNHKQVVDALRSDKFDVIIINLKASKMNAIDIRKEIRKLDPAIHVILYSEDTLPKNLNKISNHDPYTFMIQSSDEKELMKTLSIIEQKMATSREKTEDLDRLSLNIRNLEEILKLFKTLLKK